jgi:hypothetical protein
MKRKRKFSVATFPFSVLATPLLLFIFYVFCQELQITPCAVLFPHKYFSARLLAAERELRSQKQPAQFQRKRESGPQLIPETGIPRCLKKHYLSAG